MVPETRVKSCPYCQLIFQQGIQVIKCPECQTLHHYTCWQRHDGCVNQCGHVEAAQQSEETAAPQQPVEQPVPASASSPAVPELVPPVSISLPTNTNQATSIAAEAVPAEEPVPASTEAIEAEAPPTAEPCTPPAELTPVTPELEHQLSLIHLRIKLQQYDAAKVLLETAEQMAPDHPAVLEIKGDIAFEQGRYRLAEEHYRRAFKADPTNTRLEEKFATALVKVHEPEYLAHAVPDDSPWNMRMKRPPAISAIFSFFFPGSGQLYNGDILKGLGLLVLWMGTWAIIGNMMWALHAQAVKLQGKGAEVPTHDYVAVLLHFPGTLLMLIAIVTWIYATIDAAIIAKRGPE